MKNQGFINRNARGNALVIILIMIALLAALTITFTRMGDNTTEVSQEQANVIASQVLRQAKSMSNAVDGLIAKGCSMTQLSFENSTVTGYTNAQTPSDNSCKLFDAAGAGMTFPTPPANSNDGSNWYFPSYNSVRGVGPERETLVACTTNCQELIMILPMVNLSACKALNILVGLSNNFSSNPIVLTGLVNLNYKFSAPSTSPYLYNYSFAGNTGSGNVIGVTGTPINSQPLWDKKAGCVDASSGYIDSSGTTQTGTGIYLFYQVLVER